MSWHLSYLEFTELLEHVSVFPQLWKYKPVVLHVSYLPLSTLLSLGGVPFNVYIGLLVGVP